jgi:four helix bundle protein
MGKKGFRDLFVWQKSKDLAVEIYKITNEKDFAKDFGFKDQIRRSAISISSNIAEGDERDTDKEAVRFFFIAKGSLAELSTQLQIACEIGFLDNKVHDDLENRFVELGKMLGALIKARSKSYRQ